MSCVSAVQSRLLLLFNIIKFYSLQISNTSYNTVASKKKICSYCSYIPDKSTKVNIFPYVVSNHTNTKSRVISPVSTDKKEKKEKKGN